MEDLKKSFDAMSELEQALYIGGGKEYVFDGYGKLLETKENDLDYNMGERGSAYHIIHNELTFSSYAISWENANGTQGHGICTQIEGGDLDMFRFLASNTNVEWGAMFNGGKHAAGSSPCKLITNNSKDYVVGNLSSTCDTYVHSHPDGYTVASEDDKRRGDDEITKQYQYWGIYNPKTDRIVDDE